MTAHGGFVLEFETAGRKEWRDEMEAILLGAVPFLELLLFNVGQQQHLSRRLRPENSLLALHEPAIARRQAIKPVALCMRAFDETGIGGEVGIEAGHTVEADDQIEGTTLPCRLRSEE